MWWRTVASTGVRDQTRPTVAQVLLQRRGLVYAPAHSVEAHQGRGSRWAPDPLVAAGVTLLEADLLERGFLASPALVDRLLGLDAGELAVHGGLLLADLDAALGADRPHVPLFRGFPRSTPKNTLALWADRVLALIFQHPEQPCVLCGRHGTVVAVAPCAHLVCRACFDGADYSACPICHRRLDPGDPFLQPSPPRRRTRSLQLPDRARVLTCGEDADADAHAEIDALLARTAALSPGDLDDLDVLLATRSGPDLSWLPERIPARETKAFLLARLLRDATELAVVAPVVVERIDTATDALRVLVVLSGGSPGLVEVPRFAAVPRPVRRVLLQALDRIEARVLVEDLRRHRRLWIHAAERLHPFEHARDCPTAALAFAALRGTALGSDRFAAGLVAAAGSAGVEVRGGRVSAPSFSGLVEETLADRRVADAVRLLSARPGDLLRRLDHLLRLAADSDVAVTGIDVAVTGIDAAVSGIDVVAVSGIDAAVTGAGEATQIVLEALPQAATRVAPAVLVAALGELRGRAAPQQVRVFFPKGGTAKAHIIPDDRGRLPQEAVTCAVDVLTGELLRRAELLGPVNTVAVDAALDRVIAPFTQRTASRALVTIPRGSVVPLPEGRHLRLFLHWLQDTERVDLDLSLALYDEAWRHRGTCDYTHLRAAGMGAVHSGDLTSAPPPLGASEFVDLDAQVLAAAGVRHVVAAVFSYNNVAFEDIPEAFAGVMLRADKPDAGSVFDPRSVEQRFDLVGRARACVPLVIDLQRRTLRWLDVVMGVTGSDHAVHRHSDKLAALGEFLGLHYDSGARVSLGEAARWHAAARASTVLIRAEDGSLARLDRAEGESTRAFLDRLISPEAETEAETETKAETETEAEKETAAETEAAVTAPPADLAFLISGDLPVADGASVYALHPRALDANRVTLIAAADVAGTLTPPEA